MLSLLAMAAASSSLADASNEEDYDNLFKRELHVVWYHHGGAIWLGTVNADCQLALSTALALAGIHMVALQWC